MTEIYRDFADFKPQLQDIYSLNGIIQIFNLFYLKEQVAQKALKLYSELCNKGVAESLIPQQLLNQRFLADYDIAHLVEPVYLGFGDLAFKSEYKETAKRFFNAAVNIGMNNMEPVFER